MTLDELIAILGEEMHVEPLIDQLPPQLGEVGRPWADVCRARELLRYQARVPFREEFRRFVAWMGR